MSVSNGCEYRTVRVGHGNFCIDRRYSSMKVIGTGAYGVVVSAVDKVTGRKVAIKKIKDVFCDTDEAKRILRELKLLHHFTGHENVVQLLDIMSYPPKAEKIEDMYIVTNFMDRDLARIIDSKQRFSDQHLQYFLYQILRGVKFIHSANVLHRDLKPENIVVNLNCDLAICDFGLARGFDAGVGHLTEYVVTRHYRPPELLLECAQYGKPLDVWSVGCIFAELILRKVLFCGETPQHQLRLIVEKIGMPSNDKLSFVDSREALRELRSISTTTPPLFSSLFPANTNTDAIGLLEQMLRFAPDDRINIENALSHPYLKDFHGHMSEPVCKTLFDFGFEQGSDPEVQGLTDAEVRRMMYEEMCKFRPERLTATTTGTADSTATAAATAITDSITNSTNTSAYNYPTKSDTSNVSSPEVNLPVSVADSVGTVSTGSASCDTIIDAPTTNTNVVASSDSVHITDTNTALNISNLHLTCSTDRSCDTDDSLRTIELFGRSISSSVCSADCNDTTATTSIDTMHSMSSASTVGSSTSDVRGTSNSGGVGICSNSIHSVFSVSQDAYPSIGIASVATESNDKYDLTSAPDLSAFTHSTSNHLQSVFSISTDPYPAVGIASMTDRKTADFVHHAHVLPPAGHRHSLTPSVHHSTKGGGNCD